MLEDLREIFMDKKRRPKRDEPVEATFVEAEPADGTEFYV